MDVLSGGMVENLFYIQRWGGRCKTYIFDGCLNDVILCLLPIQPEGVIYTSMFIPKLNKDRKDLRESVYFWFNFDVAKDEQQKPKCARTSI